MGLQRGPGINPLGLWGLLQFLTGLEEGKWQEASLTALPTKSRSHTIILPCEFVRHFFLNRIICRNPIYKTR